MARNSKLEQWKRSYLREIIRRSNGLGSSSSRKFSISRPSFLFQEQPLLAPLLYKNGSAEARSQVMHSNYGGSILDYDNDDLDNMCADVVEGFLAGPTRYGLGELDPYMDNYYDERSHIDKALGTYNGSIYWVQGLQDWNVDPHQVFGGPPGTKLVPSIHRCRLRGRWHARTMGTQLSRSVDETQQSGIRIWRRSNSEHDAMGLGAKTCLNGWNITSKALERNPNSRTSTTK